MKQVHDDNRVDHAKNHKCQHQNQKNTLKQNVQMKLWTSVCIDFNRDIWHKQMLRGLVKSIILAVMCKYIDLSLGIEKTSSRIN